MPFVEGWAKTAPRVVELPGEFEYDALSPNGSILYVVEHLAGPPAGHYQVRAVDIATGVDCARRSSSTRPSGDEAMAGWPIAQLRRARRDGLHPLPGRGTSLHPRSRAAPMRGPCASTSRATPARRPTTAGPANPTGGWRRCRTASLSSPRIRPSGWRSRSRRPDRRIGVARFDPTASGAVIARKVRPQRDAVGPPVSGSHRSERERSICRRIDRRGSTSARRSDLPGPAASQGVAGRCAGRDRRSATRLCTLTPGTVVLEVDAGDRRICREGPKAAPSTDSSPSFPGRPALGGSQGQSHDSGRRGTVPSSGTETRSRRSSSDHRGSLRRRRTRRRRLSSPTTRSCAATRFQRSDAAECACQRGDRPRQAPACLGDAGQASAGDLERRGFGSRPTSRGRGTSPPAVRPVIASASSWPTCRPRATPSAAPTRSPARSRSTRAVRRRP